MRPRGRRAGPRPARRARRARPARLARRRGHGAAQRWVVVALAGHSEDVLELAARYAGERPSGHEASIASTLARSIAELDAAALDFVRLAAALAVQPIPAGLVVAVLANVDALDPEVAGRRATAAMHDATIRSLAESAGDGSRQVHALVSRRVTPLEREPDRAAAIAGYLSTTAPTRTLAPAGMLAHARRLATPPGDHARATLLAWVAEHELHRGDFHSARELFADDAAPRARRRPSRRPRRDDRPRGGAAQARRRARLAGPARRPRRRARPVRADARARRRTLGAEHHLTRLTQAHLEPLVPGDE